jgi:hypothetical protein
MHGIQISFPAIMKQPIPISTVIIPVAFVFVLNDMPDRRGRMMKQHSRSGIAHYNTDLFPHFWFVAVYFAAGTKGLGFHKRTFLTSDACIIHQLLTFITQMSLLRPMIFMAVQTDHLTDKLFLTFSFGIDIHFCTPLSIPDKLRKCADSRHYLFILRNVFTGISFY